ncbi:MAG: bifunctional UDP-N-acetylglucosamine diphosphorylase/glucosamine-1-phosphate N-acetyltransferase GlmU [Acidobacteria bacterium]|nr:bifunctional UDP-N-acetylglucosamine diphosphorylase/glucosamine-1-phosphate N-acetyltransferase GlmU [Acidobacteriota bacterium]
MRDDLTIVILAAGLGTRMKSRKAKVLHEAGGLTLIEHVVQTALQLALPERIVAVVGHQADEVRAKVAGAGIGFCVQAEQLGTGHAVMSCREALAHLPGHLVVLYGDTPLLAAETLRRLVARQIASGAAATVITTEPGDPTGYGRAITDDHGDLVAIVEHKVATPEQRAIRQINSGIYCFRADLLWKHLLEIRPNPVSKELYLTDIVEILHGAGYKVASMPHTEASELLGINNRIELAAVDEVFRRRKVEQLMLDGVTIQKPATVMVDAAVRVGVDTVVEPFAQLLGSTAVGTDCRIGAGAIVRDSRLADGVRIWPYTLISDAVIEDGASVGPFARLREGAHMEREAHVGNFVELKQTKLGRRSKSGHLSYLGDAEIGAGVNIGAGTITCNYDGVRKSKTIIGSQVFVGSNATLVAPVELGGGSYVAAGSVITDAVPADALALGRSRQVVKEGWAKRRREGAKAPPEVSRLRT